MTALKVDAKDHMNVTLTKTSLGILQNLGQVLAVYVVSIWICIEISYGL